MAEEDVAYTQILRDMLGAFQIDMTGMQDAFKTQATLGEKLAKVALEAAEKSTEISAKWAKDTLAKAGSVTEVKEDPADYAKAMTDFAAAQAEMTAESLAAFAEIAKKIQMETVELMLAAGRDMQEDATAAVKKATEETTASARRAAVGGDSMKVGKGNRPITPPPKK